MSWEDRAWLGVLAAIAVWIFIVLPFLYEPSPRFTKSDSPPQAHSEQPNQDTASEPRGTIDAPFIVQVLPTPKTAEEKNNETQERQEKSSTDWWIMAFTGAVALFTLMLVGATILLYRAGNKQIGLINQQIAIARNEFSATHRPWVPITKVSFHSGLIWAEGNAIVVINVFCKNTGNSPAQRVSLAAAIFPFLHNDDITKEIAKLQENHHASNTRDLIEHTLFPNINGELCLSRGLMIPESHISSLKDRFGGQATEMIPVILGAVEYYFSFGERIPHYTPFVYHLSGTETEGIANLTIKLDGCNVEASNMILVPMVNAGEPT